MSDFLIVRGIDALTAQPLLDAWKATRQWVRTVELRDSLEPRELEINRKNAIVFLKGKHKRDLMALVSLIQERGGRVVHLMERGESERIEQDLDATNEAD
jgi:hypothetical protein